MHLKLKMQFDILIKLYYNIGILPLLNSQQNGPGRFCGEDVDMSCSGEQAQTSDIEITSLTLGYGYDNEIILFNINIIQCSNVIVITKVCDNVQLYICWETTIEATSSKYHYYTECKI